MERQIIKHHADIITSLLASHELMEDYRKQGYQVKPLLMTGFKLLLEDGFVLIYWEKGNFWAECVAE